ncbi:imidazole glycerol phosphate synthase subunit HisH [bacterium]|nr:imidazole glycerol phosphate synthase subunit HisH [bacterium]
MASIAIIDYGMGNLRSVEKAFQHLGADVEIVESAEAIAAAPAVILPGVGAFGDAMKEMNARGIHDVARDRATEASKGGRPFLGICLGMQVLVDEGEEDPGIKGLGVIPGTCPRLVRPGLKIPHMGWNSLQFTQPSNPLFEGLDKDAYVYFVHSYHVTPTDETVIAATTDYGGSIAASLRKANLFACQFHPEKSQNVGLTILKNFSEMAASHSRS